MSDAKRDYSDAVIQRKREALIDEELGKKICNSFKRRDRFVENWEAVDINKIVAGIAPNSIPILQNSKIIFCNDDMSKAVAADISGYCRVQEDPLHRISKAVSI